MNYRIVEKESFKLVGFKKRVPMVFEGIDPEYRSEIWIPVKKMD